MIHSGESISRAIVSMETGGGCQPKAGGTSSTGPVVIRGTNGGRVVIPVKYVIKGNPGTRCVPRKGIHLSVGQGVGEILNSFVVAAPTCVTPGMGLSSRTGTLSTTSPPSNFRGSTFFAQTFFFNAFAGTDINIWCYGSFDTFIYLALSGTQLASDHNSGYRPTSAAGGSAIKLTAPVDGRYMIEVTSNLAGGTGDFYVSWSSGSASVALSGAIGATRGGDIACGNGYVFVVLDQHIDVFTDDAANTFVTTIVNADHLGAPIYNPANNSIYVPSDVGGPGTNVYVYDATTFGLSATIAVTSPPLQVCLDPRHGVKGHVLVSFSGNAIDGRLIDCDTNTVIGTTGAAATLVRGCAYSLVDNQFYISHSPSDIFKTDPVTLAQTGFNNFRKFGSRLSYINVNNLIYMANNFHSLIVFDPLTDTIIHTAEANATTVWFRYSPCSRLVYSNATGANVMGLVLVDPNPATNQEIHWIGFPVTVHGMSGLEASPISSKIYFTLHDESVLRYMISV